MFVGRIPIKASKIRTSTKGLEALASDLRIWSQSTEEVEAKMKTSTPWQAFQTILKASGYRCQNETAAVRHTRTNVRIVATEEKKRVRNSEDSLIP